MKPIWSSSWLRAPKYVQSRLSVSAKIERLTEILGSRACPASFQASR